MLCATTDFQVSSYGMRIMVSVWPFSAVGSSSVEQVQSQSLGVLNLTKTGPVHWNDNNCDAECYLLDQSQNKTREFFWSRVEEGYFKHNISIYWLDASEPEISTSDARTAAFGSYYEAGPIQQVLYA